MKLITSSLLIFTLSTGSVMAQSRTIDDALLLEYYQNQRFTDALSYIKTIYQEPVTDAKELSRLAYTSAMAGMLPDAENFYQRIYDKDSTNKSILFNIASINQRRGNVAKAEIYFKKLVLIDTVNFNAFNRLAQIARDRGDEKNELYYFQKANDLNPTDANVASDLNDLYIILKQESQAEKVLKPAITADPENVILQQGMLKLNYVQSKWPQTIYTGENLLLLGDSSINTLTKLARAYYQKKNYQCGIAVLSKIPPTQQGETSEYLLAACYKQLKDQKSAILHLNKAINLSLPANIDIYYTEMADSYETIKQYKKAQDAYQKSLLYVNKPITYYFLATLYDSELKDRSNALKYYKKFIASKPDEKQKTYIEYSQSRIIALTH